VGTGSREENASIEDLSGSAGSAEKRRHPLPSTPQGTLKSLKNYTKNGELQM
jgi:hypothetical protein